jgi:hypothetical protein
MHKIGDKLGPGHPGGIDSSPVSFIFYAEYFSLLSIYGLRKGWTLLMGGGRNLRVNTMLRRERMCCMSKVMGRLRGMDKRMRIWIENRV